LKERDQADENENQRQNVGEHRPVDEKARDHAGA